MTPSLGLRSLVDLAGTKAQGSASVGLASFSALVSMLNDMLIARAR